MIIKIKLINMFIISYSYLFKIRLDNVRTTLINLKYTIRCYNNIITMLYIRFPEHIHLLTECLYPKTDISQSPPLHLTATILFNNSMNLTFLDLSCKEVYTV